jgi:hypothetical protein
MIMLEGLNQPTTMTSQPAFKYHALLLVSWYVSLMAMSHVCDLEIVFTGQSKTQESRYQSRSSDTSRDTSAEFGMRTIGTCG